MSGQQIAPRNRAQNLRHMLEKYKSQIAMALPRHMTPERMMRIVLTTVQRNPSLLQCSPESIFGCVVEASQLGLEPDGILGHAYLVPFHNKHTRRKECQLIPGYKGLVDLARRSGQLVSIFAHVVYEKDEFDFEYGLDLKLRHKPSSEANPGPVIAAYAVAKLKDGGVQFDVMWRHQIDRIRARSQSSGNGPWVTDYEEMAKKTVVRRLCKLLPASVELQKAVSLDEMAAAGLPQQMDAMIPRLDDDSPGQVIDTDSSSLDQLAEHLDGEEHSESEADS